MPKKSYIKLRHRVPRLIALGVATMTGGIAVALWLLSGDPSPIHKAPHGQHERAQASFVGSSRCVSCHEESARAFAGSHHDRAMEVPTRESVLAPFSGETFKHDGVVSTFRSEEGRFLVETEMPNGKRMALPVRYTFGVFPLQQYVVELTKTMGIDTGPGRLQMLTVAWDARADSQGGQRYYSLYPDETLRHGDPLHWSGAMQNWNYVCADCHVTSFKASYDATTDGFNSRFAEPDVGCEACHGPGSNHIAWAKTHKGGRTAHAGGNDASWSDMALTVDLGATATWRIKAGAANAAPQPVKRLAEVETCAPCHARRHQIAEGHQAGRAWLDSYRPELIDSELYHADGQIDGEVYVYGSFVQSRMFEAGVGCGDCHSAHSQKLVAEGNALCVRCHSEAVYDTTSHHHHEPKGSAGATAALTEKRGPEGKLFEHGDGTACVSCHMPAKAYMEVDLRHDHSLRVPRPDLSVALGTPNACNTCHVDETPQWAVEKAWWPTGNSGDKTSAHAHSFAAARRGDPKALEALLAIASPQKPADQRADPKDRVDRGPSDIVRSSALTLLEGYGDRARSAISASAKASSDIVRLGAVYGARGLNLRDRLAILSPLLADPRRTVRIEAARTLAPVMTGAIEGLSVSPEVMANLARAADELLASEKLHASRADAWMRIGVFESARGRLQASQAAFEKARRLDPRSVPALVNLADLARARGDEQSAERWLDEARTLEPQNAEALHALGLLYVRTKRGAAALPLLKKAVELRPDSPRFAFVYCVALNDLGHARQAKLALVRARELHPHDPGLLSLARAYLP